MRGLLVTGTDTGVGKTMLACAIAAGLRARGVDVGVYKPVETGCRRDRGRLAGADVERLCLAAGGGQSPESASSFLYELAAAPLVAARAAGVEIDSKALARDASRVLAAHSFTIVEGAGGLLVPIAAGYTFLDFAREIGLPVAVVVGSKLGCINHALLTLGTLDAAGVACAGFFMNEIEADGQPSTESNLAALREFTRARCLGVFPSVPPATRDDYAALGKLAREHLDLGALAG